MDFDLAIEDIGGGRFRARVLDSPAGQASAEFDLPFSEMELENFLLKIGRPRSGTRRLESPETAAARDFGGRLFDAVFAEDVATQWVRSVDSAEATQRGLRLRLRLSDAPKLSDLPWEYLYSPTSDDFVVLSSWTPMVRYISLDKGAPPLQVAPPLRMLVMISNPSDYPRLDVEAEWARLHEGMADLVDAGMVEIHRLDNATLRELQRTLRRTDFHLFHFIGHGGFDTAADDGVLLLETDEGRAREVSGRQLGTILDDARTIRVAMLNACEGARSSGSDPFSGVAQSLVARGIPAVVAMQFEITDRAAIVFAHEFYTAVTDGMAVEGAVGEARRAVFGAKSDVEWGTAVLYMRAEDGRLFDLRTLRNATLEMEATTLVDETIDASSEPPEQPHPPEPSRPKPDLAEPPPVAVEPETVAGVPDTEPAVEPPEEQPTVVTGVVSDERGRPEPVDLTGSEEKTGFLERYPSAPKWAAAVVGVLIVFGIIGALAGDPADVTPTTAATTAAPGGGVESVVTENIVALTATDVTVDGRADEWLTKPVVYDLPHRVANDLGVQRLGEDPLTDLWVGYDNDALYVFVEVVDEVYSQPNAGNQIWRGDAFNINVSIGDAVPSRPDSSTFQLTMTPRSDLSGNPEVVRFTGNGQSFAANTTDGLGIELAGTVRQRIGWTLEARIPWSVFGLESPPARVEAALFAVFDNDGEMDGDQSAQAEIMTNVEDALFQDPPTWGTLATG